MKIINLFVSATVLLLTACTESNTNGADVSTENSKQASAQSNQSKPKKVKPFVVTPALETLAYPKDGPSGFDADDPAIWVNPDNPSRSLVAATLKRGGMDIYDVQGRLLQQIKAKLPAPCERMDTDCDNAPGRWNNVDVVYDFNANGVSHDLFLVSDRGTDTIDVFKIDKVALESGHQPVVNVTSTSMAPTLFTSNQQQINQGETAYGLASVTLDQTHVFVTQNNQSRITHAILATDENGNIGYTIKQTLDFPSKFTLANDRAWQACTDDDHEYPHFEGIVADKHHQALYLAQEDIGIWKVNLTKPENVLDWQLIAKVNTFGVPYTRTWSSDEQEYRCQLEQTPDDSHSADEFLHADVEGLTIFDKGDGNGYLLASSQGNNSVVLFERGTDKYITSFTIVDGDIDGVNETDGMMVSNANFGGAFEQGVLILQDGVNKDSQHNSSTNFKYVPWASIAQKLEN